MCSADGELYTVTRLEVRREGGRAGGEGKKLCHGGREGSNVMREKES